MMGVVIRKQTIHHPMQQHDIGNTNNAKNKEVVANGSHHKTIDRLENSSASFGGGPQYVSPPINNVPLPPTPSVQIQSTANDNSNDNINDYYTSNDLCRRSSLPLPLQNDHNMSEDYCPRSSLPLSRFAVPSESVLNQQTAAFTINPTGNSSTVRNSFTVNELMASGNKNKISTYVPIESCSGESLSLSDLLRESSNEASKTTKDAKVCLHMFFSIHCICLVIQKKNDVSVVVIFLPFVSECVFWGVNCHSFDNSISWFDIQNHGVAL
jgi:hypothetical protein